MTGYVDYQVGMNLAWLLAQEVISGTKSSWLQVTRHISWEWILGPVLFNVLY